MLVVRSSIVMFIRSATPFYKGFLKPSSFCSFLDSRRTLWICHCSICPYCRTTNT